MTPERETKLRENIFEMWYELLRRSCATQCDPELYGTPLQLDSEYKILEKSKDVLKKNFVEHYYISDEIKQREKEHELYRNNQKKRESFL